MDTSSGPKAHTVAFSPDLSGLQVGPKSEILDMIKIRKAQLKFRRTVLLKRQKFRMRLSEVQEEEVQISELAAIAIELRSLTVKQRELGYIEDDDEDLSSPSKTEECIIWPAPPPCILVPDANKVVPIAVKDLRRTPAVTGCPNCGEIVTTKTSKKRGDAPWIVCCLSAICGCIGGCCLIPFCLDCLMDIHHSCPLCQTTIHIQEKM